MEKKEREKKRKTIHPVMPYAECCVLMGPMAIQPFFGFATNSYNQIIQNTFYVVDGPLRKTKKNPLPFAPSLRPVLQVLHEAPPDFDIDHPAHAVRGYDPAQARRDADAPVLVHLRPPVRPRGEAAARQAGAIVQVQPEQVDGCGEDLDEGGCGELYERLAADAPARLVRQEVAAHERAQERRDVEAREDGHAVAQGEEGVRGDGDAADGLAHGAEHARVDLVLVDAQADVGGRRGGELGGAGGDEGGGLVLQGRGRGVEDVGGQVGAAVDGEDEGHGAGEEHGVWAQEEGAQGVLDGGAEARAARGVLHDGPVLWVNGRVSVDLLVRAALRKRCWLGVRKRTCQ